MGKRKDGQTDGWMKEKKEEKKDGWMEKERRKKGWKEGRKEDRWGKGKIKDVWIHPAMEQSPLSFFIPSMPPSILAGKQMDETGKRKKEMIAPQQDVSVSRHLTLRLKKKQLEPAL